MPPEVAVAHWQAELTAPHDPDAGRSGEVTYFGRLGVVWRPGTLRTIVLPDGHPDAQRTATARRLLGTVETFDEHRLFATRHRLTPGSEPHLADGELSPAMLLEYVLATGDWVRPENRARQHLLEIGDLTMDLPALRLSRATDLDFGITARGAWSDGLWTVRVAVAGIGAMTLRYAANPVPLAYEPVVADGGAVSPHRDADLWCTPGAPRSCLPHPALAAILEDARRGTEGADAQRLSIDRLVLLPGCLDVDIVHRSAGGYRADAAGVPVIAVERVRFGPIEPPATPDSAFRTGSRDRVLVHTNR
ncbi:hypothetical protein ACFYUD_31000 [Nocardia tengchongensis]|uniref:hypothetical protein n=1 Tax=Nocardia tengchongensis TaxID=2055889 RepID=UPI00369CC7AC